jgi:integrase
MTGHIVQRGKGGVWYLYFDEPRERGEKRKQQGIRLGTMPKTHALAKMRKILRKVDEGTWKPERRDITVQQLVTAWLDGSKNRLATNTHVRYTGLMTQHVIPSIGNMPVVKVEPRHLTKIMDAAQGAGLASQTVLHIHRALHTAFQYGVQVERVVTENVVSRIKPPRVERRLSTSITPERVSAILTAAQGSRLEVPVTLAALTGLRRGELLALKWAWVNLDQGSLFVAEALEHTRGHGVAFKAPKSRTSRRVLPIAPECVVLLRAHKEAQDAVKSNASEAYRDLDLVFPNPDGAPWPPDSFSVQFGKLARTAGCQGFRLHDLRHSFATLMLADSVSIREVSDMLGHSSKALTLSTYAHAMPGGGQAAVSNLARTLLTTGKVATPP